MTKDEALKLAIEMIPDGTTLNSPKGISTLLAALGVNGFAVVPITPTNQMLKAAYCQSGVGDNGGAERADFEDEWKAVLDHLENGTKPAGLIELVRPWRSR